MKKLIYAADDEAHIRELLQSFLEKEGFEVRFSRMGRNYLPPVINKCPILLFLIL